MNTHRRLKIASRISALLQHHLGEGIDPPRMVVEPLYARDVLLVCEALRGSELAALALQFKRGEPAADAGGAPGFSASRFFHSIFGSTAPAPLGLLPSAARRERSRARGWFARARVAVRNATQGDRSTGGSTDRGTDRGTDRSK